MNFLVTELIRKKREGRALSEEEIAFLVDGFAKDLIPDYQIASWLMATFLRGMDFDETLHLTKKMKESGESLNWRDLSENFKNADFADKHSTGGVGDKVSLILAPLATCFELKVPMMSGRSLGHTGGTVDKFESIRGFSMYPDQKTKIKCLDEVGACMMAQNETLCPADRKLYSLRDVTATIESVPLITASIVSKKWAEGIDAIVYDVKTGSGAFMEKQEQAITLSHSLVKVSKLAGMAASTCITRMDEPLGSFVGNSLEVFESLCLLKNEYKDENHKRVALPLKNLCCALVAEMAVLAGTRSDRHLAGQEALKYLENGKAHEVFMKMCRFQGAVDGWEEKLPRAKVEIAFSASKAGFLQKLDSRKIGLAGIEIGMGRRMSADKIIPEVGFEILKLPGDPVEKGEALIKMHLNSEKDYEKIKSLIESSLEVKETKVDYQPELILERISS